MEEGYLQNKIREQGEKIITLEQQVKQLVMKIDRLKDAEELLEKSNNILNNKDILAEQITKEVCKLNYEQVKENWEYQKVILDKQLTGTVIALVQDSSKEMEYLNHKFNDFTKKQNGINNAILLTLRNNGINLSEFYINTKKLRIPMQAVVVPKNCPHIKIKKSD